MEKSNGISKKSNEPDVPGQGNLQAFEILRKFRPEIDRFKCGHYIKLLRFKRQLCYTCLLHSTLPCCNGTCIDLSRFFYTDCRIVNALYLSLGTQFQQRLSESERTRYEI